MKKTMVAMAVMMAVILFGCSNGSGGPGGDPLPLSGNITISPSGTVDMNTQLTAHYSGHEAVSYHWEKDGAAIGGATSVAYTPTNAGIYCATVSASGYISKTSAQVTVNDPSLLLLEGDVTINSPSGTFAVYTLLTATYTGSESVTYHWEKDGETVGATGTTYTPTTAGSYTVIVKATDYNEKVSEAVTVRNYVLGDTGPGGGKIFYINEVGFTFYQTAVDTTGITCHYLEAAPADQGTSLAWASTGFTTTDITGTGTVIGTGKKNTALILATDANAPAAKACKDYTHNGKSDWFLPSKDERNELYVNRTHVGNMRTTGSYWSSSQYDYIYAWIQSFSDGSQVVSNHKNNTYAVRAVRAF